MKQLNFQRIKQHLEAKKRLFRVGRGNDFKLFLIPLSFKYFEGYINAMMSDHDDSIVFYLKGYFPKNYATAMSFPLVHNAYADSFASCFYIDKDGTLVFHKSRKVPSHVTTQQFDRVLSQMEAEARHATKQVISHFEFQRRIHKKKTLMNRKDLL